MANPPPTPRILDRDETLQHSATTVYRAKTRYTCDDLAFHSLHVSMA
jgi:hypothetical protein